MADFTKVRKDIIAVYAGCDATDLLYWAELDPRNKDKFVKHAMQSIKDHNGVSLTLTFDLELPREVWYTFSCIEPSYLYDIFSDAIECNDEDQYICLNENDGTIFREDIEALYDSAVKYGLFDY